MGLAVVVLALLILAPSLLQLESNLINMVNQTVNSTASYAYSYQQNLTFLKVQNYRDPFITSVYGYLYPLFKFFYLVDTTPVAFYSVITLDVILMAFDVYWLESEEVE